MESDFPKEQRERSDSSASTKRRRVLDSDSSDTEAEDQTRIDGWRGKLEAIILDDRNRISKTCGAKTTSIFTCYEMELFKLKIRIHI